MSDDEKNVLRVQKGIENISSLFEIEHKKDARKEENKNHEEELEEHLPEITENNAKGSQNENNNVSDRNEEKMVSEKIKIEEEETNKNTLAETKEKEEN